MVTNLFINNIVLHLISTFCTEFLQIFYIGWSRWESNPHFQQPSALPPLRLTSHLLGCTACLHCISRAVQSNTPLLPNLRFIPYLCISRISPSRLVGVRTLLYPQVGFEGFSFPVIYNSVTLTNFKVTHCGRVVAPSGSLPPTT